MIKSIDVSNLPKAEWLTLRHGYVNSSESAALFGLSKWHSKYSLWHEKRGDLPEPEDGNERMTVGTHIEGAIATLALERIVAPGGEFKHFIYDDEVRMGANFDWKVAGGKYSGWLIECKNVDFLIYRDQWTDTEAPPHIEVQVQHQLELCPTAPGCIIAALVGGNQLKLIFRKRDPEFGAAIKEAVIEFWGSINEGVEPQPNWETDSQAVISLHQSAFKDRVLDARSDKELLALAKLYKQAALDESEAKSRKEKYRAQITQALGEHGKALLPDGWGVSLPQVAGSPGKTITQEMVGQVIGARSSYRRLTIREPK